METNTLTKTEKIITNDSRELVDHFNQFVNELKDKVNTTTFNGEPVYTLSSEPKELNVVHLINAGIRNKKRFKRYLNRAIHTQSLRSINKLFHLVYKRIMKLDTYPKMRCEKHEKIQKMRNEWKKQQEIADQLLVEYQKEKGDFYKQGFKF